ncbi:MAG TPA: di-heme oxidoredictase family protein [Burkholderiales bacterium]|nr:di-heme oxidoredictase family protein [Burkholderiales bacterium]
MKPVFGSLAAAAGAAALFAIAQDQSPSPAALSAGSFTSTSTGAQAFSVPVATLDAEQRRVFADGHKFFHEAWVVAPDMSGVWGLGPTFNEDRCSKCHEHNGRAGAPRSAHDPLRGMLVRLSLPGRDAQGAARPHPDYGDQLNDKSIPGVPAEGRAVVDYETVQVAFADGETIELRRPRVRFSDLQFGPLGEDIQISVRIAPAVFGLGLLEAVPEAQLLAIAEQQARYGISGRPNYVWDYENDRVALGRFGWKANQPSLRQQIAAAFIGDIGATSWIFREENCPGAQIQCREMPSAVRCGGQGGCTGQFRPDVIPSRLASLTFYLQALTVPARRDVDDPEVQRGEKLFERARCSLCHVPELTTGDKTAITSAAAQTIRPYTDLLLHDMGDALADHRPDFLADGREWRTPPLWGLGLYKQVNGKGDLLHDGRARSIAEAILWHGGEAEASRELFRALSKAERSALVRFVQSL